MAIRDHTTTLNTKKISLFKFIVSYILLMAMFLLLIGLEPIKNMIDINNIYTRMVVKFSVALINFFGEVKAVSGSIIQLKDLSLDIQFGCNGLEAFMIYIAAVLSFPASLLNKSSGIIIGFIVLQIINIIRIAGLGLVGIYLKDYFHYFHVYVAQGMMIVVSFVIFLLWLQYVSNKKNTT